MNWRFVESRRAVFLFRERTERTSGKSEHPVRSVVGDEPSGGEREALRNSRWQAAEVRTDTRSRNRATSPPTNWNGLIRKIELLPGEQERQSWLRNEAFFRNDAKDSLLDLTFRKALSHITEQKACSEHDISCAVDRGPAPKVLRVESARTKREKLHKRFRFRVRYGTRDSPDRREKRPGQ